MFCGILEILSNLSFILWFVSEILWNNRAFTRGLELWFMLGSTSCCLSTSLGCFSIACSWHLSPSLLFLPCLPPPGLAAELHWWGREPAMSMGRIGVRYMSWISQSKTWGWTSLPRRKHHGAFSGLLNRASYLPLTQIPSHGQHRKW